MRLARKGALKAHVEILALSRANFVPWYLLFGQNAPVLAPALFAVIGKAVR